MIYDDSITIFEIRHELDGSIHPYQTFALTGVQSVHKQSEVVFLSWSDNGRRLFTLDVAGVAAIWVSEVRRPWVRLKADTTELLERAYARVCRRNPARK